MDRLTEILNKKEISSDNSENLKDLASFKKLDPANNKPIKLNWRFRMKNIA